MRERSEEEHAWGPTCQRTFGIRLRQGIGGLLRVAELGLGRLERGERRGEVLDLLIELLLDLKRG